MRRQDWTRQTPRLLSSTGSLGFSDQGPSASTLWRDRFHSGVEATWPSCPCCPSQQFRHNTPTSPYTCHPKCVSRFLRQCPLLLCAFTHTVSCAWNVLPALVPANSLSASSSLSCLSLPPSGHPEALFPSLVFPLACELLKGRYKVSFKMESQLKCICFPGLL